MDLQYSKKNILQEGNNSISINNKIDIKDIFNEKIHLKEIGNVQKKILDCYRLSEDYRNIYGGYLLYNAPNGVAVQSAKKAIKDFGYDESDEDLIIDLIYTRHVLDFRPWEYFVYGFRTKEIEDRLEYLPLAMNPVIYRVLNLDKKSVHFLRNKYLTYKLCKDLFRREMISVNNDYDKVKFIKFAYDKKIIIKPIEGAIGKGIETYACHENTNYNEIFLHIRSLGTVVCEEIIEQDNTTKMFHPRSVNTVRIFTYNRSGSVDVVVAWFKAGKGSAIIDNAAAGGMCAEIDINTGIIISDARDEANNVYEKHPDTKVKFNGFQLNQWKECINMVKEAAKRIPGVPFIGWDVALSTRGWCIVEGNDGGMINVIQIPAQRGMKRYVLDKIEWDKNIKKYLSHIKTKQI